MRGIQTIFVVQPMGHLHGWKHLLVWLTLLKRRAENGKGGEPGERGRSDMHG